MFLLCSILVRDLILMVCYYESKQEKVSWSILYQLILVLILGSVSIC